MDNYSFMMIALITIQNLNRNKLKLDDILQINLGLFY